MRRSWGYHHCRCGYATARIGAGEAVTCVGCGRASRRPRAPGPGLGTPADGRPRVALGEGGYRVAPLSREGEFD